MSTHGDANGAEHPIEVVLVTGMSGAGRTTVANVLEDLDWYVVDNLPPQMMRPLVELVARADGAVPKIAIVTDSKGRAKYAEVEDTISDFLDQGLSLRILFLDAADEVLVRRFESTRRPHPLQGEGTLLDGIEAEREALESLKHRADIIIDTSDLNVHQLGSEVRKRFSADDAPPLRLTVMSFGFKYGLPKDADNVADVRFLPNPYWIPHLRGHNGLDSDVADFVLGQNGAEEFIERYTATLDTIAQGYLHEGRGYALIGIGCTGGKHRSVAISERIAKSLTARTGIPVTVRHRDLGRE
ncbi:MULTISPECIES: RNase adapter RapZ [Brevibacterium]|uniref:GlmZ(SRNA)-inactivating NTPase n=5 Tax=Bacteria TaxID=2 RepID=K9AZK9_9MICO|nr:RNase adapter RapZ [Brevibacterium casei]NJE68332.1 RNase adapter RapZ [Brevibacterium sp. LS14]SII80847.1 putative P-loop-containing kinase [Mycobacteroides abscessus subsp. abscessus]EKU47977.1 glmZ(sRNA)-inactivating NTPase [Brevibacterium casei S18]KZE18213.1 RNase adaptor protein RapZ [Brevibacterium casei]MBE4693907.1 RNase adapter RapZ [Brevibacterium casei]